MGLEPVVAKYLKDDSAALAKILKQLEVTFKEVEATRRILPQVSINNLDKVKQIQLETLSHYGILEEWHVRVDSLKKNKQAAYFQSLRNAAEAKNEKFTAATAEQEASLYVAEERRVRDLIAGKLNFALETIKTCRNLLNEKQYPSQSSLTA